MNAGKLVAIVQLNGVGKSGVESCGPRRGELCPCIGTDGRIVSCNAYMLNTSIHNICELYHNYDIITTRNEN